jgi:hypothetical protein
MTAINALIEGFFDYAGLFPPAGLHLSAAIQNYLDYSQSKHCLALGRFVLEASQLRELRQVMRDDLHRVKLTVIAGPQTDWDSILQVIDDGGQIESIEAKAERPEQIEWISRQLPLGLATYFEVPFDCRSSHLLDAICAAGARVKLRMGGLVADAIPTPEATACIIQSLAERHLIFKATAGLHHPLRSSRPTNGSAVSSVVMAHGFINLFFAAAFMHLGGEEEDARAVLDEVGASVWQVSPEAISWRSSRLNIGQISEVRHEFFTGVGSCSFTEPIADLEALGWL